MTEILNSAVQDNSARPSADLPYAHGPAPAHGSIRARPEDFQVEEELGFEPTGSGEHVLLQVRKRGSNTDFIARALARCAGVPARDVSYAGLKDRAAVTTQWFSVLLPRTTMPDWSVLESDDVQILQMSRHHRKLRRGALNRNRFTITIRDIAGDMVGLENRLARIRAEGVPNYFGEQRFGHDNVGRAAAMLEQRITVRDRFQRGIYLSALRAEIFNRVLAARVQHGLWASGLEGDVMMLAGSHSFFVAEHMDEVLSRRLSEYDIHPTGPLWGRGELHSRGEARAWEEQTVSALRAWTAGLEHAGLTMERRSLRLLMQDFSWTHSAPVLTLTFGLPAGCYATSVLRELVKYPTGPSQNSAA